MTLTHRVPRPRAQRTGSSSGTHLREEPTSRPCPKADPSCATELLLAGHRARSPRDWDGEKADRGCGCSRQRDCRVPEIECNHASAESGPNAFPRLNAPMLTDEARFGASAAAAITRTRSGGTRAKLAIPHRNVSTATGVPNGMSAANATKTAESDASVTISVAARSPPRRVQSGGRRAYPCGVPGRAKCAGTGPRFRRLPGRSPALTNDAASSERQEPTSRDWREPDMPVTPFRTREALAR